MYSQATFTSHTCLLCLIALLMRLWNLLELSGQLGESEMGLDLPHLSALYYPPASEPRL